MSSAMRRVSNKFLSPLKNLSSDDLFGMNHSEYANSEFDTPSLANGDDKFDNDYGSNIDNSNRSSNASRFRRKRRTNGGGDEYNYKRVPTMGEFYQQVMTHGSTLTGDGTGNGNTGSNANGDVLCFKSIVFMILTVAALTIGNAAFIFTSGVINTQYLQEFDSYAVDLVDLVKYRMTVAFQFTTTFRDHLVSECIERDYIAATTSTSTLTQRHHRQMVEEQQQEISLSSINNNSSNASTSSACNWPFVTFDAFEERHYEFVKKIRTDEVALIPFVSAQQRDEWEMYSVNHQGWLQEGIDYQYQVDNDLDANVPPPPQASKIIPYIHVGTNAAPIIPPPSSTTPNDDETKHAVFWQLAPAPSKTPPRLVNYDGMANAEFQKAIQFIKNTRDYPILSQVIKFQLGVGYENELQSTTTTTAAQTSQATTEIPINNSGTEAREQPRSWILAGIGTDLTKQSNSRNNNNNSNNELVGIFGTLITWSAFFASNIPLIREQLILVLEDTCEHNNENIHEKFYTYTLQGRGASFLGYGDLHDINYEKNVISGDIPSTLLLQNKGIYNNNNDNDNNDFEVPCGYKIHIYPTEEFRRSFETNDPLIYTSVVLIIMLSTIGLFCMYDYCVERREGRIGTTAAKSNALVNSLFPDQVRDQLLQDEDNNLNPPNKNTSLLVTSVFQNEENQAANSVRPKFLRSKPIAELFPETTIMFADIVGFTAWSSAREPAQVFTLLETIYNSFDAIAKRRGIFKVETIGDSYVAGAGLPEPRRDHAVAMARFAYSLIRDMNKLVKVLEVTLGPDTEDLTIRIGLHSGPVTGGVLRGEKSRFQLFGDTVNTAARMESNGLSGKVHMSQDTANLLKKAGRAHWVKAREDVINAKGKGKLRTYWLDFKGRSGKPQDDSSNAGSSASEREDEDEETTTVDVETSEMLNVEFQKLDKRSRRVVDWLVQMLIKYLKQIVAMRDTDQHERTERRVSSRSIPIDGTVLDEVQEIIALPTLAANYNRDPESVKLEDGVESQLRHYVSRIAALYRENPFHNFEHASHVTMSVAKLLSRIVSPHDIDYSEMTYKQKKNHAKLHQQTYGITSDPLTQFAIIFSALIHDVDHCGVPNAQLVKEGNALAKRYRGKSVAEQNSVDLSWAILMSPRYEKLVRCICCKREERTRFRQLVVNAVMATDIVDKELGALRKQRWDKAFNNDCIIEENPRDRINRKATIVIEHLIQASDVAHTMQHWHVYLKWNGRFFKECYKAYKNGRSIDGKDPSENWYQGELGFFDYYIIPLANKLRECGVFGVSSDEYLNYAMANREEWEKKGRTVVEGYMEAIHAEESM